MRQIKFRAWNKKIGQFHYFDLINIGSVTRDFTIAQWVEMPKQQFTGLLDKNGKEIYEGDIVQHYDGQKFKVEYVDGRFKAIRPRYPMFDDERDLWTFGEAITIIGNIYESKHLLKETPNE